MSRPLQLFILFLVINTSLLFSCSERKEDSLAYDLLNMQLTKSTQIIEQGTKNFGMRLEQMTYDPMTADKAKIWNEKAKSFHLISEDLISYIEGLKIKLNSNKEIHNYDELFEKLKWFQNYALNITNDTKKIFGKELNSLISNIDSIPGSKDEFINTNFSITSINGQKSILSKLQNDVAIVENLITAFLCYQIGTSGDGFIIYKPIVTQNATHLKKGEKLMITAGVGTFYNKFKPNVVINGKEMKINECGEFIYSIDISGKSGKYSIPVEVEYYGWDTEKKHKTLNVDYFIDN